MTKERFLAKVARLMQKYPYYSQEEVIDPVFGCKLFDMAGSWTWYLAEYNPETRLAFGYVTGLAFDEWGAIPLDELTDLRWCGVPRIEIDKFFKPTLSSAIIEKSGK